MNDRLSSLIMSRDDHAQQATVLLSELAHNAGCLLLYEDLLTRVWGPEYRDDVQILRTWISRFTDS